MARALSILGPGIVCVGYTIGTGAVTKLASAGASYGWQPLWILGAASVIFWLLLSACDRVTLLGCGILQGFRTHIRGGRWLALVIVGGVVLGQWTGLPVLVGVVSHLIFAGLCAVLPEAASASPYAPGFIAVLLTAGTYFILRIGSYLFLERVLVGVVGVMVIGFVGALLMSARVPGIGHGLPPGREGGLLVLSMVGIALAAPTFLLRSLVPKLKGRSELGEQRRDAAMAAVIFFIIGASVVACTSGGFFNEGRPPSNIMEVVLNLDGRFAGGLFLCAALGAGVSSLIPMAMILPLLLADYRQEEVNLRSRKFRALAAAACVVGAGGAFFGDWLLLLHRIASQVAQVFVLPLVVGGVFLLLNRTARPAGQPAGFFLNAGLAAAFAFSLVNSWFALSALRGRFA